MTASKGIAHQHPRPVCQICTYVHMYVHFTSVQSCELYCKVRYVGTVEETCEKNVECLVGNISTGL